MITSSYRLPLLMMIVFITLLFSAVPFLTIYKGQPLYGLFFMPVFCIVLLYLYFQKGPRVIFDSDFITVKYLNGTKTHDWTSVRDIFLSRKETYWGQLQEATVIVFENGDKLPLWDSVYGNLPAIRSFLVQQAGGKVRDTLANIKERNLLNITRRRYAGNVITSLNTIIIGGFAIFCLLSLRMSKPGPMYLSTVWGLLVFYIVLGTQMNYFVIDDGYLIIRNHYFPWKNIRVSLNDVEEADIETPNKRSTGLRILLKNFNSKIYNAGTLRKEHWDDLIKDLIQIKDSGSGRQVKTASQ